MTPTEKKVILMATDDWNEHSFDNFPLGVFDCEENALDYGVAWLENQEGLETYEEFLESCGGKPRDYLEQYNLYFYPTSYEPTTDDFKKVKLRKEIDELRSKLATLETALYRLEDS